MAKSLFFQEIKIDGELVDQQDIIEGTYIERMNLTCPKILLKFFDKHKQLQDDFGLKNGSVIDVTFGDVDGRGDSLYKDRFIVGSNRSEGNYLLIEATQQDIHHIKQPAATPLMFVNKTPAQILKRLLPDLKLNIGSFSIPGTYHVMSGSTIAIMLKQMRSDYGGAMWILRGVLYFHPLKLMMSRKHDFIFEYARSNSETIRAGSE